MQVWATDDQLCKHYHPQTKPTLHLVSRKTRHMRGSVMVCWRWPAMLCRSLQALLARTVWPETS